MAGSTKTMNMMQKFIALLVQTHAQATLTLFCKPCQLWSSQINFYGRQVTEANQCMVNIKVSQPFYRFLIQLCMKPSRLMTFEYEFIALPSQTRIIGQLHVMINESTYTGKMT